MSADNFHEGVEKEMKEMNNVYDFHDFRFCVALAGDVTLMNVGDFFILKKGTETKSSQPLLSVELFRSNFEKGRRKCF